MKKVCKRIMIALLISFAQQVGAQHAFNATYQGNNLQRIAFPIGGIGAGMFCIEGTGAISHMSIRHEPEMFNEPMMFAALFIKGKGAKVLEGQVPGWKKFGQQDNARGGQGKNYGLARCSDATFSAKFPFAEIVLTDKRLGVKTKIKAWNPFIPTDADNSSLPVGAMEFTFTNETDQVQTAVFSYSARNFLAAGEHNSIGPVTGGFLLKQDEIKDKRGKEASFAIWTNNAETKVDYCWFRGGWWDPLTMAWKKINEGDTRAVPPTGEYAPGASLYVPFSLKARETKTIIVYCCWYVPHSDLKYGTATDGTSSPYYMPWYAGKFKNIEELIGYWKTNYETLKKNTGLFTNSFYKSTLAPEVTEAIAANLTILKSTTVLRQYDGRFWGWEGSNDFSGSCAGTCTHVYNYAQGLSHLFPALDRTILETELHEGLDSLGHQNYREGLPVKYMSHDDVAAADGQLGGLMRTYRHWRVSGDNEWIKKQYPKLKLSLDYCIRTWDPEHTGTLMEPHHNTYDIEFWGADAMCTSMYLGALEAFIEVQAAAGQNDPLYKELLQRGRQAMEKKLFNGEYFVQDIQWKGLHQVPDTGAYHSPEAKNLLNLEGPKYQYGKGCLSDGVIGCWLAAMCGLPQPVDQDMIRKHLESIYRYNYKTDLRDYSNPQRSTFALGKEGGVLLCTWPKGGALSLPFVYSNEVWTGVEYEVASHLILEGKVKEGLEIVRTLRKRYDGTIRNPFDEYECGHWYMRAMSSYGLLQALTGTRYDAVTKTLYMKSRIGNFTTFISTATGFGNVEYRDGKVKLDVVYGTIPVSHIEAK